MDLNRFRLFLISIFLSCTFTATASPWEDYKSLVEQKLAQANQLKSSHQKARLLILDEDSLRLSLNTLARGSSAKNDIQQLSLPLADGSTISVKLKSSKILPLQLSKRFPDIKTYRALPDDQVVNGRIDLTPGGFHAMIQMRSGDTFLIDPENGNKSKRIYLSYRKQDQKQNNDTAYSCNAKPFSRIENQSSLKIKSQKPVSDFNKSLLTYKIAIAATGEYVAKHGGNVKSALAAIVSTLNRVNQVFEQELGVHLSLVENNDQLIYTDADSDPYNASTSKELLEQNQQNIDAVIGNENYDIGHLFTTKGGGLAAIASVCNQTRKAQGVSGVSNPENDSFNLDFVAHEIAHQLGATHTFNGVEGLCSGDTREERTAFEPGSGSTIMSYAGYCGVDNLQPNTDAMLHIGSIKQISDFTTNDSGNRCGTRTSSQNSPPIVNAGNSYIIPAQTPFELTGSASDDDKDQLVYAWEQIDAGEKSQANDDRGDNALFRVHLPTNTRIRSFPPVKDILDHTSTRGELLPTQQRFLNFSFVAQDSYNSAQSDEMTVEVLRTGSRFALNMPRSSYNRGETYQVFWNVAATNMPPINCDSVDIKLSTDGGYHFDQTIALATPNTGEAWVTIPSSSKLSTRGRFKISCSDNIFFAVSHRNFIIKDSSDIISNSYEDEDQPELNLKDRALEEDGIAAPIVSSQQTTQNAAGGAFSYLLLLCLLVLFIRSRISHLIA